MHSPILLEYACVQVAGVRVLRGHGIGVGDISSSAATTTQDRFAFTPQQADAYGIHELHVLEDVLRQSTQDVKAQVALRIRAKIGWRAQPGETDIAFLEAYYAALRRRLEQRMIFGDRKTDKFDTR